MTRMTSNTGNITVAPAFALYFLYTAWVWLCDGVDLLCYLTGLAQCTLLSRLLVTAVLVGGVCLLARHVRFRKSMKPDAIAVICMAVLFVFAAYKAILPDLSWDILNYHLIVQEPGFFDSVTWHYIPGNFQMYGFRWADRLFYAFRSLLGYRMGTLLNYVAVVLIYAQVRRLLADVFGAKLRQARSRCPRALQWIFRESMLAFWVVMAWDVTNQMGTYFVDLLALPFALEALYLLLTEWDKPQSGKQMVWYAFLNGCFFAFKMTQVVYVAPLILLYLFLHRKDLTAGRFAAAFLLAMVPVSIYLVYNFAETGNPIFPYFNSVFESPYFGIEDFKDRRWGPQRIRDFILWPFISNVFTNYYACEVPNRYPIGTTLLMLMVVLQCMGMLFRKEMRRPTSVLMMILLITSAYAWTFSTGYIRYFVLGEILMGIVAVDLYARVGAKGGWKAAVLLIPAAVLLVQPVTFAKDVLTGHEIAWRDSTNLEAVARNLPDVLRDRNEAITFDEDIPKPDMILMTLDNNGGPAYLMCEDVPIVSYWYLTRPDLQWSEESRAIVDSVEQRVRNALDTQRVYDLLIPGNYWDDYMAKVHGWGMCVEQIYWPETFLDSFDGYVLIELKNMEEGCGHAALFANSPDAKVTADNAAVRLQTTALLGFWRGTHMDKAFTFSVVATDGVTEQVVYTSPIEDRVNLEVDAQLDLTGFQGDVELYFTCYDDTGAPISEDYECLILNPSVT